MDAELQPRNPLVLQHKLTNAPPTAQQKNRRPGPPKHAHTTCRLESYLSLGLAIAHHVSRRVPRGRLPAENLIIPLCRESYLSLGLAVAHRVSRHTALHHIQRTITGEVPTCVMAVAPPNACFKGKANDDICLAQATVILATVLLPLVNPSPPLSPRLPPPRADLRPALCVCDAPTPLRCSNFAFGLQTHTQEHTTCPFGNS